MDDDATLREREKLMRGVRSLAEVRNRLPPSALLVDSAGPMEALVAAGHLETVGPAAFLLTGLPSRLVLLPRFLSPLEERALAREVLETMVDAPPHSNSLMPVGPRPPLWPAYQAGRVGGAELLKLRWASVGAFHYDWGRRAYDPAPTPLPPALCRLYSAVSQAAGAQTATPEAALVNLYHSHRPSERLGGHRDDVELADASPLVTVSLGRPPALFLAGPAVLVLRGGDALLMEGEARQVMHAVPAILEGGLAEGEGPHDALTRLMGTTRISLSIRRVSASPQLLQLNEH